jgi:hypothetical protein
MVVIIKVLKVLVGFNFSTYETAIVIFFYFSNSLEYCVKSKKIFMLMSHKCVTSSSITNIKGLTKETYPLA